MLKKILILSLILNTPYILPAHSSAPPGYNVTAIFAVAGTICTWLAYKDFKQGWLADKEFYRQLKILNEMGVEVYKVAETGFEFRSLVIKEYYTMDIPSHFSQQQKKKAKKHWNLLLTNDKYRNEILGWPAMGSILLMWAAGAAFWETFTESSQCKLKT